jgi:DNA processing protein
MDALRPKAPRPHGEITVIRHGDDRYPPLLRQIPDPPAALYIRGRAEALTHPCPIAVVGTRKMTAYGATAIRLIVGPSAAGGIAVVSGLALGVDAAAHVAALDAGGVTVAVLAGGTDAASVGPRTNAALAERIVASGGALVSEHPPGTTPAKFSFPKRNRIIAGLSLGTMVIEAATKSGSLITAYAALDDGRDVFAVPGPITSAASAGTNGLLRRGAVPITEAAHLLEFYGLEKIPVRAGKIVGTRQRTILDCLADAPKSADELAHETHAPMNEIIATTTMLALEGFITEDHGLFIKN